MAKKVEITNGEIASLSERAQDLMTDLLKAETAIRTSISIGGIEAPAEIARTFSGLASHSAALCSAILTVLSMDESRAALERQLRD